MAQANPWVHPSPDVRCTLQTTGTAQHGLALSTGEYTNNIMLVLSTTVSTEWIQNLCEDSSLVCTCTCMWKWYRVNKIMHYRINSLRILCLLFYSALYYYVSLCVVNISGCTPNFCVLGPIHRNIICNNGYLKVVYWYSMVCALMVRGCLHCTCKLSDILFCILSLTDVYICTCTRLFFRGCCMFLWQHLEPGMCSNWQHYCLDPELESLL